MVSEEEAPELTGEVLTRRQRFLFDAYLTVVVALVAVAAGLLRQGGPGRTIEILVVGAGVVLAYLVNWRVGIGVALVTVAAFLAFEHRYGRLDRGHYWQEVLYATGVLAATVASAYLRLAVDTRGEALERARSQIRDRRTTDTLTSKMTGGKALSSLDYELERSRRHNHQVSLLVVRPDEFDDVVQRYGEVGRSATMDRIAEAIGDTMRATDIPLREPPLDFAIILPETRSDGARTVAERIRLSVGRNRLEFGPGAFLDLTVSIGIACFPDDATSNEELVAAAKRALSRAVELGGNRTVLHSITGQGPRGWGLDGERTPAPM